MDIKAKIELRNLIEHYGIDEIKEALKEIELEYRPQQEV
jgi:hypothetical protein